MRLSKIFAKKVLDYTWLPPLHEYKKDSWNAANSISWVQLLSSGFKLCLSFDEATVLGTERYLTINAHHSAAIFGTSRSVPLGLVRLKGRATGEYLRDAVKSRLASFSASLNDFFAAVTDGGSNVVKAVDLMMLQKQKCMVHGLHLVVSKVISGKEAIAFDVAMFFTVDSEEADSAVDNAEGAIISEEGDGDSVDEEVGESHSDDEDGAEGSHSDAGDETNLEDFDAEDESGTSSGENKSEAEVVLGEAISRLRKVAREFKKRPLLMDEIRRVTVQPQYNGRELVVLLDCRTRWWSTLDMIERALEIQPALNYVLSLHSAPIGASDFAALRSVASLLAPFKRAMLALCKPEANLLVADKVFRLLFQALRDSESPLARLLLKRLKKEILKRRTVFSSVLQILEDPKYDFEVETEIGQRKPTKKETLSALTKILRFIEDDSASQDCGKPSVSCTYAFRFDPSLRRISV